MGDIVLYIEFEFQLLVGDTIVVHVHLELELIEPRFALDKGGIHRETENILDSHGRMINFLDSYTRPLRI